MLEFHAPAALRELGVVAREFYPHPIHPPATPKKPAS